jgi:hypothetical protein
VRLANVVGIDFDPGCDFVWKYPPADPEEPSAALAHVFIVGGSRCDHAPSILCQSEYSREGPINIASDPHAATQKGPITVSPAFTPIY